MYKAPYDSETLQSTVEADRYKQGLPYEPPTETGFYVERVLQHLEGLPWDQYALNFVHGLRPSSIVVSKFTPSNCCEWRVVVNLDDEDRIFQITQERRIGVKGALHAMGLSIYNRDQQASHLKGLFEGEDIIRGIANPRALEVIGGSTQEPNT